MLLVKLDTRRIIDWETFHDLFAEVFGFSGFYGRNMNAWIDCMTYLEDMTKLHPSPGEVVVLQLEHVNDFLCRCPEQYAAIVDSTAFVNWRRIELGESASLALSFHNHG